MWEWFADVSIGITGEHNRIQCNLILLRNMVTLSVRRQGRQGAVVGHQQFLLTSVYSPVLSNLVLNLEQKLMAVIITIITCYIN